MVSIDLVFLELLNYFKTEHECAFPRLSYLSPVKIFFSVSQR